MLLRTYTRRGRRLCAWEPSFASSACQRPRSSWKAVSRRRWHIMLSPRRHWRRVRTNNPLERILREICRRTRVVGAFPDGQSALNLAAARLTHIAGSDWSTKRYLSMDFLKDHQLRKNTA